jgi:hypothetical protein
MKAMVQSNQGSSPHHYDKLPHFTAMQTRDTECIQPRVGFVRVPQAHWLRFSFAQEQNGMVGSPPNAHALTNEDWFLLMKCADRPIEPPQVRAAPAAPRRGGSSTRTAPKPASRSHAHPPQGEAAPAAPEPHGNGAVATPLEGAVREPDAMRSVAPTPSRIHRRLEIASPWRPIRTTAALTPVPRLLPSPARRHGEIGAKITLALGRHQPHPDGGSRSSTRTPPNPASRSPARAPQVRGRDQGAGPRAVEQKHGSQSREPIASPSTTTRR